MTQIFVNPGDPLQEAANGLKAGDELVFRPGIHHGMLWVPVSEVTVRGEDGAVIDGTLPLDSDNWEEATDSDNYCSLAGTGVWRVRQSNPVWILTAGSDEQIFRIDSDYINVRETLGYYNMTAYEAMAVPDNARPGQDYGADWWNGLEAMFCYNRQNGYLYLRYRDGRRPPDGMRWSGGVIDHRDLPTDPGTVIMLWSGADYAIKNLHLRGAVDGIATWNCTNVVIDGCTFRAFDYCNRVVGSSENVSIRNSDFDLCLRGFNAVKPISKISTEQPYPDARLTAYHQYATYKFFHDESDSTHGSGLAIQPDEYAAPKNVEFASNYATSMIFGADAGGDGNEFHHNRIENLADMPFQRSPFAHARNVSIHDNICHEAGYGLIRWHAANEEAGDNYFYNNRLSDIDRVSDFVYLAPDASQGSFQNVHSDLRIWFYHNSFSGGNSVWIITNMLSMQGFMAVNNVINHGGSTSVSSGWPSEMGAFDYNALSGSLGAGGSWYGPHNIINMPQAWPSDQVEKDFVLPDNHPARGSAIDVSKPFILNSVEYEPLPGFEPGYALDRGWIDRGEEPPEPPTNGGEEVTAIFTVEPEIVVPGADVEVSWSGGQTNKDWYALYKIPWGNEYDEYGWAYTSSCGEGVGNVKYSGTCIFTMPEEPGVYDFHFYLNDSEEVLAISNRVTVSENNPEPEPEPDMVEVMIKAWVRREDMVPVPQKKKAKKK
jgi:hypothetical protein